MKTRLAKKDWLSSVWMAMVALIAGATVQVDAVAQILTVNVVGSDGLAVPGFRWLVEEDATKPVELGVPAIPGKNLAVSFHTSYMPVVAKGDSNAPTIKLDDTKRYFVSALPNARYAMGGAAVAPGQTSVTITVQPTPLPTGQVSVFIFEDSNPINNEPDLPQERGLPNFTITLVEAGGTYGASGGQVSKDAFSNPLNTTYLVDAAGNVVFNADGTPKIKVLGNGIIKSDANGVAVIKYLPPAKYTIYATPPPGTDYHQTTTIEGTKGNDAWIAANEPTYFQEFGAPGHHVFQGFVKTVHDATALNGNTTITGRVVNLHNSRPPEFTFYNGDIIPNCWVGLNLGTGATGGQGVYTIPCKTDGTFSIANVPAGKTFQLVIWDESLDLIFAMHDVKTPIGGGVVDLQDVPVFNWFGRMENHVFFDTNKNGFPDPGEVGVPGQTINLRFRDGSIYQSLVTDSTGTANFTEVFPFFNWFIAEVDFARFKATGVTVVVDNGGAVPADQGWTMPSRGKLNPQPQSENGGKPYRTETGPVLLEAYQAFLGQTHELNWGKATYLPGENGGITGIVHYATTRAENDPRLAKAENWEPGIPRVQVNLYQDFKNNVTGALIPDGVIDDVDGDGVVTLSDVDNPDVYGTDASGRKISWRDGGPKGPNDIDRNGNGVFDKGDAVRVTQTDSWDDKLPTGCQGTPFVTAAGLPTDCYDGLRNFGQVRPDGVFDGGYAFGSAAKEAELPVGTYIVEANTPPGYDLVKEEDKNVDFGDAYTPKLLALPAVCVGDAHALPEFLALFTDQKVVNPSNFPYNPAKTAPLCDRKQVKVSQSQNAAADFFLFTEVPVAGHMVGFILDDLANEFDATSPTFGEKHALPFLPISIRDWTGLEINRVYSDQYGTYNGLVPSTYSVNIPVPSGVSPNMVTACMNSPGPIKDTRATSPTFGQMILDPYFDRRYSQFCYTLQYLPGKTTYLDTPVVPVAAFAGPNQFPLDCECEDKAPIIYTATGNNGIGPWVPTPPDSAPNMATTTDPNTWPTMTIVSAGQVEVKNPAYDGTAATTQTIFRDYGFGNTVGKVMIGGLPIQVLTWNKDVITARIPPRVNPAAALRPLANPAITTGELTVTRGDNQKTSAVGLTFTVDSSITPVLVAPGQSIQSKIDSALPGSLILVAPGKYEELVIMHKKVQLQGWGAASTVINAVKTPVTKLEAWRTKLATLYHYDPLNPTFVSPDRQFDLLPGQSFTLAGVNYSNNEPSLFNTEEGPGILVVANVGEFAPTLLSPSRARIDGFTITGADFGGGIMVNGYASYLNISNNIVVGNQGNFGGGIRLGHPNLISPVTGDYVDAGNDHINIHHNYITQNGALGGAGGGVSLYTGSHNYAVTENFICGNFNTGNGGGIGHAGFSGGTGAIRAPLNDRVNRINLISQNKIVFNQSFDQLTTPAGGGIYIGGLDPLIPGQMSHGSGNVDITRNLIQGNEAGAGDGGGIRLDTVNGQDVNTARNVPSDWYTVNVLNNMIVDNVTGMAGGAISVKDALKVNILHNTIANNDSMATAGAAFAPGSPNQSTPQPAGVVAWNLTQSTATTPGLLNVIGNLAAALPYKLAYANPKLANNIVWHNRSFYWAVDPIDPTLYGLYPAAATTFADTDLAVIGAAGSLAPTYSLLTNATLYGSATNFSANPLFVSEYSNGAPGQTIQSPATPELTTAIFTAPAFDEGGNFIDAHFGPLTLNNPATGVLIGDYHLQAGSPALGKGSSSLALAIIITPPYFTLPVAADLLEAILVDYDGQPRPTPIRTAPDIGADER